MDGKTPGLSVRPLIDMGWGHVFNETFFEDVKVPAENRVGEENRGWYVGATLLDFERSKITGAVTARRSISRLIEYAQGDGSQRSRLDEFPNLKYEVADRFIESEVMFNFSLRFVSMQG